MRKRRRNPQAGLTLVELMIALVITSIAITAALGVGYSMMNSYRDHRRATAVERAARSSLDILANAVRAASPGISTGQIEDLANCTSKEWDDSGLPTEQMYDAIKVIDGGTTAPDQLLVIYAAGGVLTTLDPDAPDDYIAGAVEMTLVDASEIRQDDLLLVIDSTEFDQGHLVKVEGVAGNVVTLKPNVNCGAVETRTYPAHSFVMRAGFAHFYVDDTGAVPYLKIATDASLLADSSDMDAGDPVAEGVEDLQVAVGLDDNGNNVLDEYEASDPLITTDDWHYNADGDLAPATMSTNPWRALRITVVARSTREVSQVATSTRPPAENRIGATAADPNKRRSLTTVVQLRNMEVPQ